MSTEKALISRQTERIFRCPPVKSPGLTQASGLAGGYDLNESEESLTCMDAMFNDCEALTVIDLSSFTTDKVKEFSQMFEACASLQSVIGLVKFNTANCQDFSEMFNVCYELKELDLSTFDTRNSNKDYITDYLWSNGMLNAFLSNCNKLEKITFGPYFSFDGDGSATGSLRFSMPAATGVEGWDGYWYNAETGEKFLPSEFPEEIAATYVAVNPNPAP